MKLSLATLGSKYVEQRVMEDIEELYDVAAVNKLQPIILCVGPLFLDICSVQAVISELQIRDWIEELNQNNIIIREIVKSRLDQYYAQCDAADGIFDVDEGRKVIIFFDPDDKYITLICKEIDNPNSRTLRNLKLRDEEVLPEIISILENQ